jgi:hypothetical protein
MVALVALHVALHPTHQALFSFHTAILHQSYIPTCDNQHNQFLSHVTGPSIIPVNITLVPYLSKDNSTAEQSFGEEKGTPIYSMPPFCIWSHLSTSPTGN